MKQKSIETGLEIAIIGMAGRFPGAGHLEEFWENLKNGVEAISFFTDEELKQCGISEEQLSDPLYVKAYGIIRNKEYFDSSFFGYTPKEAESMDPQVRLFHECSWQALEDAGCDPSSYSGSIGTYAGIADGFSWRALKALRTMENGAGAMGMHMLDTSLLLSEHISHKLDLKGPSMTVFTACSTALVAVHLACRALLTGECDMALAGAVSVIPVFKTGYLYQEGMILSPDGHCRPFDEKAGGTVFGEGVGIVILKRLKDARADRDFIQAVIKGTAVNNDGVVKASFTSPGKKRIADVIRTVLKISRVEPGDISYIETHGTATSIGDTIEFEALKLALASNKKGFCGIGSVKSNIGHLDVTAGMAGLIKTVLALRQGVIPPSINFETPNAKIDMINSPFYANTGLTGWKKENEDGRLRAGVCSFGIGGTNAFVLLEEAPAARDAEANTYEILSQARGGVSPPSPSQDYQLILLSARTGPDLDNMTKNLAEYLTKNPGVNLADAAYTLQVGRRAFNHRKMLVCSTIDEAIELLSTLDSGKVRTAVSKTAARSAAGARDLMTQLGRALQGNEPGVYDLLIQTGTMWLEGIKIDWHEFYAKYAAVKGSRIPLPAYPFAGQRYWIDAGPMEFGPGMLSGDSSLQKKSSPTLYPRPGLSTAFAAPGNEIEQTLAGIWQGLFGIQTIGIHDDFYELGGDSLKAITAATEILQRIKARVPIVEIFQLRTIEKLGKYINSARQEETSPIEKIEKREYYSLSSVQRRLYVLHQLDTGSTGYNNSLLFALKGNLDVQHLESAFGQLILRHESLRTSFETLDEVPVQRIKEEVEVKVEYKKVEIERAQKREDSAGTHLSSSDVIRHLSSRFIRPFDLSRAPLLRVGLIHTSPPLPGRSSQEESCAAEYILMIDMHHIITDGTSVSILVKEFVAFYAGEEEKLPGLRIQYKDYAQWQNSRQQREVMKKQEEYWLNKFHGEIPVLNLPLDFTRPTIQSFAGSRKNFTIGEQETKILKDLAVKEDATLFMVLLSLYDIMLAKICSQEDIVVGTPVACRRHADLQHIMGMLVNTLALRNYPAAHQTFIEFLRQVRDNTLAAFENQDYLFEDLVEKVAVQRDVSRNPIFDTMFAMQNFGTRYGENLQFEINGLSINFYEFENNISIFDLSLTVLELENTLTFVFEYCTKLFQPETVDRFIGFFKNIVSFIVEAPTQRISHIPIISEADKNRVLYDFNDTEAQYPRDKTAHALFKEQVQKTPDNIAAVGPTLIKNETYKTYRTYVSYRELNCKTDQLASLLKEKGIGPDIVVGIMVERSVEMIIGILGILKAGGAYLPLDPEYPEERIKYMLEDSSVGVLLTTAKLQVKVKAEVKENTSQPQQLPIQLINIESELASVFDSSSSTLTSTYQVSPANLVYIIYTSGSTGRPKGVMLEHRNVVNLIFYQYGYTPIDFSRVLQFTTICFDVSFQEIFSTLLWGGVLVLISNQARKHIPDLFRVIEENQIKTLFLPASFLRFIFNEAEYGSSFPGCVDHIAAAGEQIVVTDKFRDYLKANAVYLHNHYGPTETHIATALAMEPQSEIPVLPSIGKPLSNTRIYILDKGFMLQPIGVAGELFIGGIQVGRGYLNRPELTNQKLLRGVQGGGFLEKSPPGRRRQKIYQTGDLARWLGDGKIEFLGRIDTQVKIRGFRVELGDIESHLLSHKAIEDAVVIERKDLPGSGEQYLCAYIAASGGIEILPDSAELKQYLARRLPDYMVPSFFVPMERIPLTLNGKVDRKALPKPGIHAAASHISPRNREEESLAEIWSEVLGLEKSIIGIDSDFFHLGGHSLKATIMLGKIHKRFDVDFSLSEIFKAPTIRGICSLIILKKQVQKPGKYAPIVPVEKKEYYPVSSAQKRLYILYRVNKESTVYNMPSVLELKSEAQWDRHSIEETFKRLVCRHESFRTSFEIINEEPVQRIEEENYKLQITNIVKNFIRPFDLSQAPLLRVGLIDPPHTPAALHGLPSQEGNSILMVDMHHIISDGMSIEILIKEFMALQQQEAGDTLPGLRLQYKDYSEWQRQRSEKEQVVEKQQAYWLKEFAGERPIMNLPYDYPRPAVQSFSGEIITFELQNQELCALNHLAKVENVTLFMLLLAVFNILLGKLSGQEDIVIGTPTAGRIHPDLEPVIGMFVNTLALRNYPLGEATFTGFLSEVKKNSLTAFENQDYPLETLVEKVVTARDAGRNPLFDVMFALYNIRDDDSNREKPGTYAYENKVSRFDMTWMGTGRGDRIDFEIEYGTKLFKPGTIRRFFIYFKKIVTAVINDPYIPIARIEIISAEERKQVLYDFNETGTEYPRDKTIHALFQEQVERTPDNIAAAGPTGMKYRSYWTHGTYISYRELSDNANQLARLLIEKGVGPDNIVGIMVESSIELIVGILGILKAGGAYLPIDPNYPGERIDYMLEDSSAKMLLSDHDFTPKEFTNCPKGPSSHLHLPPAPATSLAYIIYTSGSTGKPKGTMIDHASVVNILCHLEKLYPLGEKGTYLLKTNYTFDVSVTELFGWFFGGGQLVLIPKDAQKNPTEILEAIQRYHVTHINFVPALFNAFLESLIPRGVNQLSTLNYIFLAGEELLPSLIKKAGILPPRIILENIYGPTEAAIYATKYSLRDWDETDKIPIGKPLANVKVYIFGKNNCLQPVGVPGELGIAGDGTARGYLNNPGLTAEKFDQDLWDYRNYHDKDVPFGQIINAFGERQAHQLHELARIGTASNKKLLWGVQGGGFLEKSPPGRRRQKIYKSGDLARWLADGNIEFLGRIDFQVKIRGFRIELGEIENHLLNYENIKEVVVAAKNSETDDRYLCAYFVAPDKDRGLAAELKEFLSKKLPDYMVPLYFVQLEKFPLTANGKIDRKALPEPLRSREENYVAPKNHIHMKMVELWSQILGIKKDIIGIDSNFFELGGQSLKATILITKIHQYFNVKLSLAEMFKRPFIRGLAEYIKEAKKEEYTSIKPLEKKEYYPLSSPQKRLYILQQLDPTSTVYHISHGMELNTGDDENNLAEIFRQLLRRHESFRTSFLTVDEEPVQRIHEENYELQITNYKGGGNPGPLRIPNSKSQITNIVKDFIRPFDLSQAPLLRVGLIRLQKKKHILLLDMHHIISDGTSMKILLEEFQTQIARKELPALRIRYKDYARWQTGSEIREWIKDQEKYWLKEFSTEIPVLNLTTDYIRPAVRSFAGAALGFELEHGQTAKLKTLALEHNVTLFMLLFSLVNILLAKLSSQEDIVIGIPTAGRRHADLQQIIGMFVNTLAVRNYPRGEKSFTGFLFEIKKRTLDAFENQDYPFEELVEKAVLRRDTGRNPLFDVMFTLQDISEKTSARMRSGAYQYENSVSRFDMAWMSTEKGERIEVEIEYYTKLFKRESIERFFTYFKRIVTAVTGEPGIPISRIEVISAEERKQVLYDFNDTTAEYPGDKAIHTLSREQAERTPDNIAAAGPLTMKYRTYMTHMTYISYRKLNERAHQLAHILIEKGVGPDTIVGIMVERSIEMLVGILGILHAGGAYLPVDSAYPEERIKFMLEDSRAKILLSGHDFTPKAFTNHPKGPSSHLHLPPAPATSLVYTIYTSGSTGRPKGVLIQHQNVVSRVKNSSFIDFTPGDRLLLTGAIGFDITTFEIWWPLLNGLSLFLADQHVILNADRLGNFMIKHNISILHLIPGLFNQLASQCLEIFSGLKYFLVGGDLVQPQYINLLRNTSKNIKILHMYGPTENTTFSTFHPVNQDYDTLIPIGKPIGNSFVYIVDKFDQLVPVGVPGELLVGGEGLARGYLNRPELTAEKFDHDLWDYQDYHDEDVPFGQIINAFGERQAHKLHELTPIGTNSNKKFLQGGPGGAVFSKSAPPGRRRQKIYKSGDLARWRLEGNIEFLGRIDSQVKIRGIRIEPGEIENQLLNHKKIKETLVILCGLNQEEPGEQYLCAYIVPTENQTIEPAELRNHLAEKIPGYMIPAYFILLDNIPLTANGKVDLKALPAPGVGEPGKIELGPRSPIEKELVNIWTEVLKLPPEKIGIDSNFFELGGHSLKAAQLMARIQNQFNTPLSLKEIFKFPTIRQLGTIVSIGETSAAAIPNVEEQEYYQVSYNQARLWNFQHLNPGSDAYNICGKITFNLNINVNGVRETLYKLIRRHESFRTRFGEVNGQPVQFIEPNVTIPLEIMDISSLQQEKKELQAEKIYKENCRKPFDLSSPPLFRAVLLKLETDVWDFIFVMHHIISDGWSHELIKKEFMAVYNGILGDQDFTLPPLQFRYRDFALWQRRWSNDPLTQKEVLNYWRRKLAKGFPELQFPHHQDWDSNDHSGITYRSIVPPDIKKFLQLLAETQHTSLFMVMFSAFNRYLSSITGQEDIVCRIPAAGRDQPALQDIMGYLVNPIFLKNQVKHNERFVDLLHRVTENTLEAFRYQWYPFEQVLETLGQEYPGIIVSFNMLTMQEKEAETDLEQWESSFTADTGNIKFALILRITVYRNAIEIVWTAQKSLFKPSALEKMARDYLRELEGIIT